MQEVTGLVSIIIPVYNGREYLTQTLQSIKAQTYTNWEVIIVDDGSTDGTADIIEKEIGRKIRGYRQVNAGVSAARNKGLTHATGEYVIFLDADDLMPPLFLELRVQALNSDFELGFVGGWVETFPEKTILRKAVAANPEKEILFFDKEKATVPSNYIVRRKILIENNLVFNTSLASTADRFFILQLARFAKGKCIDNFESRLLYRIHSKSMSHQVNAALISDNAIFYKELQEKNLLPVRNTKKFKSIYFYSLAGGYFKIRNYGLFMKYVVKSLFQNPAIFIRKIICK